MHSPRSPSLLTIEALLRPAGARRVAAYAAVLFLFCAVQAAYALAAGSLGLLADALFRGLHVSGLAIGLLGGAADGAPADFAWSYGRARVAVLAAFAQALFSTFVALLIAAHACLRLWEPPPFDAGALLSLEFGLAGLALAAVGRLAVGPAGSMTAYAARFTAGAGGGGGAAPAPARLALHFFADGFSSLAVIAASLLLRFHSFELADALQCVAVSALTLYIVAPLFSATAAILLQRVPAGLAGALARARREASVIDGVLEVCEEHYWHQAPGCVVGSLALRLRPGAPAADVRARVQRIFCGSGLVQDLTVEIQRAVAFDAVT
jgi:cation diffusion facilitator family transporter